MSRRALNLAFAALTACGMAAAQQGPARVTIVGRVVDAVSELPIAEVRVALLGTSGPAPTVTTDRAGWFVFEKIPAGIYHARTVKDGYFDSGFGVTGPGRPASGLRVPRDARDVVIRMWPHAAIAGLVVNGEGKPVTGALVYLQQYAPGTPLGTPPSWHSVNGAATRSDAVGRFTFETLAPGEYVVCVDGRGVPGPQEGHAYPLLYAPGVRRAGQATRIVLSAGQRRDLEVTIDAAPVVPVRGRLDVPGADGYGYVELYRAEDDGDPLRQAVAGGPTDEAGRFLLEQRVEAGSYQIEAFTRRSWARHLVRIGPGAEAETIPMQPTLSVTGAATWDGGTRPPDLSELMVPFRPGPSSDPDVIVEFRPLEWVFTRRNIGIGWQQRLLDQRVVVEGLLPGRYLVDENAFARWHLLSARINGLEATEEPVIINTGVLDATFRFTRQSGGVRGRVVTGAGEPDPDAVVVLFATDSRLWPTAYASFRFAKATTVSLDGEFTFGDVHPGLYVVAADDPEDGTMLSIERFMRLRPAATQVRVGLGETVTPDLRRR